MIFFEAEQGWTPYHYAAENGLFEVCQIILENVLDTNPKSKNGLTPLHLAAQNGHSDICQLILRFLFNRLS